MFSNDFFILNKNIRKLVQPLLFDTIMSAALYRHQELAIKESSDIVCVPDDVKAKLMFYLRCMCDLLDMEGEDGQLDRLSDYTNHELLSEDDTDSLTILCLTISPDVISDRVIFLNNDMCGECQNKFFELEAVRNMIMVSDTIVVGDRVRQVRKVMFYKPSWLIEHYVFPMRYLTTRLDERIALTEHICDAELSLSKTRNQSVCCVIS